MVVVFPAQLGPRRPKISPGFNSKLIPRTASTEPYRLRRSFTAMLAGGGDDTAPMPNGCWAKMSTGSALMRLSVVPVRGALVAPRCAASAQPTPVSSLGSKSEASLLIHLSCAAESSQLRGR